MNRSDDWNKTIKEIEAYFKEREAPPFVESHLNFVRAQINNPTYWPYLMRLLEYKALREGIDNDEKEDT